MTSPRALLLVFLLAGCSSGPRRGILAPEDVPPGWTLYTTAHYQVLSDSGKADAQAMAERLEGVLALYVEKLPTSREIPCFSVRVLKTYAAYLAYGGEEATGGWYDQTTGELVLTQFEGFSAGYKRGRPPALQEMVTTAYHEAWHQYFHWLLDTEEDPPAWFDEGMADYFGQARLVPGDGVSPDGTVEDKEWRLRPQHPAWLASVRAAVSTGKFVPLREFVHMTRRAYYEEPALTYPQGWALVHFLLHAKDERTNEVPSVLVRALLEGAESAKAVDEAFAGMDLEKLEEEWKQYVREMR
ncbi:MAG: DUF1570 domain-containing protein [Planctomycetota bacterium]